jgi:CRP-like cAMP-binding protein
MDESISTKNFAAGEYIFRQGDKPDGLYLIRTGAVEIVKQHGNMEIVLTTLKEDNIFGEMSLITAQNRTASARTLVPTYCYYVRVEEMEKRLAKLDPFMRGLYRVLVKTIISMNEKI